MVFPHLFDPSKFPARGASRFIGGQSARHSIPFGHLKVSADVFL
jgi:hypothetical protein